MCLILLVWRTHPKYPCVLAANRDEFHARAASGADWWGDHEGLLAGRDLTAGGTWLGVTRSGRFAALTNFRGPRLQAGNVPSRGTLVTDFLTSGRSVADTLLSLRGEASKYNPFNMIFSDGERLGIFESANRDGRELGPGIFGLSNHLLDTPWPKVRNSKSRMAAALADLPDEHAMLNLLRDDRQAPDAELPETGISLDWERLLSSAFVRADDYGTRCSTIFRIEHRGHAVFDEWSWDPAGEQIGRRTFQFEVRAE